MVFGGATPARGKRLRFRFRTHHRWLEGEIDTLNNRLLDVLNRDDIDAGLVADAVLAYDAFPPADRHDHATINLNSVLFAVPIEAAGAPPPSDPFARVKKEPNRMEIGIGPYTATGNIFLLDGSTPREAMRLLRGRFFAVTQVALRHVDQPDFAEDYPIVLVNRRALDYIMPV